ncbi:MAG: hypothetical protein J7M34_08835, partial [Anaerolineae bacterium]|nr:hypothetical protein [Anaerolineae bacterium]
MVRFANVEKAKNLERQELQELQGEILAREAAVLILGAWVAWWYAMTRPRILVNLATLSMITIAIVLVVWSQVQRHPAWVVLALVA